MTDDEVEHLNKVHAFLHDNKIVVRSVVPETQRWLADKLKEVNEDLQTALQENADLQQIKRQFNFRNEALLRCQALVRKLQNSDS